MTYIFLPLLCHLCKGQHSFLHFSESKATVNVNILKSLKVKRIQAKWTTNYPTTEYQLSDVGYFIFYKQQLTSTNTSPY